MLLWQRFVVLASVSLFTVTSVYMLVPQNVRGLSLHQWSEIVQAAKAASGKAVADNGSPPPLAQQNTSMMLVISRTSSEDISWAATYLPQYSLTTYLADDDSAPFHPPQNKGREAMNYLTYLINNYDNLPDVSIFIHAHRYAWHNNDQHGQDSVRMLSHFNPLAAVKFGYVNLRCQTSPGCPSELHPKSAHRQSFQHWQEVQYAKAFPQVFPDRDLPEVVAAPCCAQFAVSRGSIHQHEVAYYQKLQDWLLHTEIEDDQSGRVFEYSWHIIFGKPDVYCPDMLQCFCDLYDQCYGSDGALNAINVKSKDSTFDLKETKDGWIAYDSDHNRWVLEGSEWRKKNDDNDKENSDSNNDEEFHGGAAVNKEGQKFIFTNDAWVQV